MSDDIKVYTHLASDPMVKASDHYRIVAQKDAVIMKLREVVELYDNYPPEFDDERGCSPVLERARYSGRKTWS
jgi:hypothetical protein